MSDPECKALFYTVLDETLWNAIRILLNDKMKWFKVTAFITQLSRILRASQELLAQQALLSNFNIPEIVLIKQPL